MGKFKESLLRWRHRGWILLQKVFPFLRDDDYYNQRLLKHHKKLDYLIKRDTNWLSIVSWYGDKRQGLPFHEQAVKYFEYKNMIIQKRAQYVIIFLTITLLIMTGFQIYVEFFKKCT